MSRFIDKIRKAKQAQEMAAQGGQTADGAPSADGESLVPEHEKQTAPPAPDVVAQSPRSPLVPEGVGPRGRGEVDPVLEVESSPTIPEGSDSRPRRGVPASEPPAADLTANLPEEVVLRPRPPKHEPRKADPLVPSELGSEGYDHPVRRHHSDLDDYIVDDPNLIPEYMRKEREEVAPSLPKDVIIDPSQTLDTYLRGLVDYSHEETSHERRAAAEELDGWSSVQPVIMPDSDPPTMQDRPMTGMRLSHTPAKPVQDDDDDSPPIKEVEVSAGLWDSSSEPVQGEDTAMVGESTEPSEEETPRARARGPRKPLYPSELETQSFVIGEEPEQDDPLFSEKTSSVHVPSPQRRRLRETPFAAHAAPADPDFVKRIPTIALRPDKRIISYYSPADHVCEEYRLLGKNITHTFAEGPVSKRGRIVALTSAVRGEGKTLTSVNLAMTVAQDLADRVLLIDGDMRHPRVHRYLGIQGGTGFNDLVASPDPASIFEKCIVRTETGLHLLLCTAVGKSPSPILDSRQMNQILQLVRDRYTLIIIDTPPVLLATDALTLGVKSDGMLFLMRARKTQREQVQEARQRIARLDIRLLGYVINNVKTFLPRIWSRYYYGNY